MAAVPDPLPDPLALPPCAGYFPGKVQKAGKVVRAIAILSHPIPGTEDAQSAQIILPQRATGRKNDIYVFCCSFAHNVCAADKWLAFVSTTVETVDPERELSQGAPRAPPPSSNPEPLFPFSLCDGGP